MQCCLPVPRVLWSCGCTGPACSTQTWETPRALSCDADRNVLDVLGEDVLWNLEIAVNYASIPGLHMGCGLPIDDGAGTILEPNKP